MANERSHEPFRTRIDECVMGSMKMVRALVSGWVLVAIAASTWTRSLAAEWTVPFGGNAYQTAGISERGSMGREGTLSWSNEDSVYSLFVHLDRPAKISLALFGRVQQGASEVRVSVLGTGRSCVLSGKENTAHPVGDFEIAERGYARIELQGLRREGDVFAELTSLMVRSDDPELKLQYVATNEGNMFYWGRRGPSVHLSYRMPEGQDVEYAYSEMVIADGDDVVGSYFMANGFGEGYFGIQVNSPKERRVLFSVWSPFQTDNPKEIPAEQRVQLLARGPEVKTGEFGNEGSGGQSYRVYPWKSGRTYRFLTRVHPNGDGTTDYTSWFGDREEGSWYLVASFRRPKTTTHYRGFHSFLENFDTNTGYIARRGQYQNVWVRDIKGTWHECLRARFSVDATGSGGHRLDFDGGADGSAFFLRNCGFFDGQVKPGATWERTSSSGTPPSIDMDHLPRE